MKKEVLKITFRFLFLLFVIVSCREKYTDSEIYEIDKAIELVHSNKSINDTLLKFREMLGVEFIPCITRVTDKHRILGFQIVQSNTEKSPPLKINGAYKIRNIQGIDVLFVSTDKDFDKDYNLKIDKKTNELIEKGYVTVTGPTPSIHSQSVEFVFCKNDDNVFKILTSDFLYKEEMKARNADKPFIIEKDYPICN